MSKPSIPESKTNNANQKETKKAKGKTFKEIVNEEKANKTKKKNKDKETETVVFPEVLAPHKQIIENVKKEKVANVYKEIDLDVEKNVSLHTDKKEVIPEVTVKNLLNQKNDMAIHTLVNFKQQNPKLNKVTVNMEAKSEKIGPDIKSGQKKATKVDFGQAMKKSQETVDKQITNEIKTMVNEKKTSLEMPLKPQELGKVKLDLKSDDGVLTAKIVAENGQGLSVVNTNFKNIKESLKEQGIKLEKVELSVKTDKSLEKINIPKKNDGNIKVEEKPRFESEVKDKLKDLSELKFSDNKDQENTNIFKMESSIKQTDALRSKTSFSENIMKTPENQLVEKMKVMIEGKQKSLELHLKPEHLGKVRINLHSHEGIVTARVVAEHGQTANLLNSNIQQIRDTLEQQGINLQNFSVDVGNGEQRNFSGNESEKRSFSKASNDSLIIESNSLEDESNNQHLNNELNILA